MRGMRHTLIALALVITVAAGASAQESATAVAVANTPIYIAPDASRTPLRVAAQGTVFTVVAEEGEWTRVQFKDPQWGVRVGYVATNTLRVRRPDLEPMDLSVTPADVAPSTPPTRYSPPPPAQPVFTATRSPWPSAYVVGRGGLTFGTRTAPLAGVEIGGHVAPMLQVYGSFDWHRDVAPSFLGEALEDISHYYGVDVDARLPAFIGIGGVKVIAPRGAIRPYGLGGFGVGHVKGTIELEGDDVTSILEELGFLDRDDLQATRPVFEVGGGLAISNGTVVADVSYRFRKPLNTGEPFNISGIYAGIGVGF